jgi:acyl-CoA thioester hydrolase
METLRTPCHSTTIPVRWGDMDAYGHVNNTVYFRFCEQARVEWSEALGLPVDPAQDEGVVIINAACTFLIPLTYPATVRVEMFAGEPGRSSLMSWYKLYVEGDDRLYAEGSAKMVWMNHRSGRSAPIPDRLRAAAAGA